MTAAAPHVSIVLGIVVEIVALSLIPLVILRRKEPSSTAAWILALVFLPGLGATLFLLFGRDRVRLPVRWKRDAIVTSTCVSGAPDASFASSSSRSMSGCSPHTTASR